MEKRRRRAGFEKRICWTEPAAGKHLFPAAIGPVARRYLSLGISLCLLRVSVSLWWILLSHDHRGREEREHGSRRRSSIPESTGRACRQTCSPRVKRASCTMALALFGIAHGRRGHAAEEVV